MKNSYCVLTFHTTHHALNSEKVLKEYGIPVKLIPVPRQVSSSCGIAAEFPCDEKDRIQLICKQHHIEVDDIHEIKKETKNNWFSKLLSNMK